jgi:tRNA(Arg) A34 adenosine deaminase TadA
VLTLETAQQLAFNLVSSGSRLVAFLQDAKVIYYSASENPVTSLIQGVYDHAPGHARRILRNRIFTNASLDEADRGMIKVAAKRATGSLLPVDLSLEHRFELRELFPSAPPAPLLENHLPPRVRDLLGAARPMSAAFALAEEIPKREERYDCDRKVAAVLLDADGSFIAAAKNANARNRTRHAEMNLLQGLRAQNKTGLPRGARIYVTLKCCKMCAGMITREAEDIRTNLVFYGADDPGNMARSTCLDRGAGIQALLPGD